MSEKRFLYQLSDLSIKAEDMGGLMGYKSGLPPEISSVIETELKKLNSVQDICGLYKLYPAEIYDSSKSIALEDQVFNPGDTVFNLLKESEQIAVFVCTAGETVSSKSKQLMNEGMLLEGYVLDVIGSTIVEVAMDKIHKHLQAEMKAEGFEVSNRYSPGYCDWDVNEQHMLFPLVDAEACGVTLNSSALMSPIKSVSGLIGIGRNVKYNTYTCAICTQENCLYSARKHL